MSNIPIARSDECVPGEESIPRALFIGSLPRNATDTDLHNHVSRRGEILHAVIIVDRGTRESIIFV